MKIVLVSTWPPRKCGIATYSDDLVSALRKIGVDVEIICHTDGGRSGEKHVHPVIDMNNPAWYIKMYQEIEKINPDLIHIQHEFGIYSTFFNHKTDFMPHSAFGLADPLFRWKVARKPTVVTYHSVYSILTYEETVYYNHVMGLATSNIVHEPYQKETLPKNLGRSLDNVYVIPHGAWPLNLGLNKKEVKKHYGYENKKVVGLFGWWEPNKAFERVIKIWPEIAKEVKDTILVLAGDARSNSHFGPAYKKKLLSIVKKNEASNSIKTIIGAFSPEENVRVIFSFDLTVLPYVFASQSGNLAHSYTAGVPVIVSAIEGLKSSVTSSGAGLVFKNDKELKNCILKMLKDNKLRISLAGKSKEYSENVINWIKVAEKHKKIYELSIDKMKKPINKKYLIKRTYSEKDFRLPQK